MNADLEFVQPTELMLPSSVLEQPADRAPIASPHFPPPSTPPPEDAEVEFSSATIAPLPPVEPSSWAAANPIVEGFTQGADLAPTIPARATLVEMTSEAVAPVTIDIQIEPEITSTAPVFSDHSVVPDVSAMAHSASPSPENTLILENFELSQQDEFKASKTVAQPQVLEETVQLERSEIDDLMARAMALAQQGKDIEAISLYEEALTLDSSNLVVQESLAELYSYVEDYNQSIVLYEVLLMTSPNRVDWQLRRAELLGWGGNYPEAIAAYDAVLSQRPDSLSAQLGRAQILTWSDRPDLSLPLFESALADDPNNRQIQIGQAEALLWNGDFAESAILYESLLSQTPNERKLQLNLAKAYQSQSKVTDSLRAIAPLLETNDPEALEIARELQRPRSQTTFEGFWKEDEESFQSVTGEVKFRINDSDTLQSVSLGAETYQKEEAEEVTNVPLRFSVEGQLNSVELKGTVGADIFGDGITAAPYLEIAAKTEISPDLYLLGKVTQERYKDDARVIRNEINRVRIEPGLFWQVDRNTSLYAGYGLGLYSNDNTEHDLLLEAKRQWGDFFISGVGYYQSFSDSETDDYFAPSSYWFYSGEAGWQGKVAKNSQFTLAASVGQQRYSSRAEDFYALRAGWMQKVSDRLDLELNYRYGSQSREASASNSHEQTLFAKVNYRF